METKNVIAAISLSAAVIILYSLFFAPPPVTKEQLAEKNKTEQNQNTDAPSLDQKETITEITREEALKEFGLVKGSFMGLKRILSCHPIKFLGGGDGFDPVKKEVKAKK